MQQPETGQGQQQQAQPKVEVCYCPICGGVHEVPYEGMPWGRMRMRHMMRYGMWPMRMGFMGGMGMGLMPIAVGFIAGFLVGSSRQR